MISIHCNHCRQLLEMDDAFAGGVCRCQFCGTIQTVPSRLKNKSSSSSSSSSGKSAKSGSSKALYKKGTSGSSGNGTKPAGTGLDELAEIVASSGLTRGSLTRPAASQAGAGADAGRPATKSNMMLPVLIGAGTLIVILLVVVIYLAMRPGPAEPVAKVPGEMSAAEKAYGAPGPAPNSPANATPDTPQPAPTPATPAVTGPAFADVPLPVGVIVYVIDCSQANDEVLDTVKAAVYRSARSLGEFRRFQIVFWQRTGEGVIAYPADAPGFATKQEVAAAGKKFEDVVAYGATELKPAFEKAVAANPAAIVITTAKGFQLDASSVAMVQTALAGKTVKVHTFALGEEESDVLKQISEKTGGTHRRMGYNQLRQFAE